MISRTRIIEYTFFFGILGVTTYIMWRIVAPFFGALAIASIIVTVSYPFYRKVLHRTPRHNRSLAALITTFIICLVVVIPLAILGYLIFVETLSLYGSVSHGEGLVVDQSIGKIETFVRYFVPSFTFEITSYIRQASGWLAGHIGVIFAETASTMFLIFIAIGAIFYFFRDGEQCVRYLVSISPLPNVHDEHILKQLARSVRSVVLGTLVVAIIQGLLTAVGFAIFGISSPILWGAVAAIGSLIPSVGTLVVFIPAILLLFFQGSYGSMIGLIIWGSVAVGMIDNILGPYLMSRGVALHPFLVLLTVLGGVAVFGPMGFVLGPVTLSLFTVLLELYSTQISTTPEDDTLPA